MNKGREQGARTLRIGLFGGSFDPVHNGHLRLAQAARRELKLDTVIFIPARVPPHKMQKQLTSAAARLAMLRLALAPYPYFAVSSFEIRRKSTTYTFETVRHFRRRFPAAEIYFIVGGDSLNDLGSWRNFDELLSSCTFVAGHRAGVATDHSRPYLRAVRTLTAKLPEVSSSEIRERVRDGGSIRGLVPPAVANYIKEKKLYG